MGIFSPQSTSSLAQRSLKWTRHYSPYHSKGTRPSVAVPSHRHMKPAWGILRNSSTHTSPPLPEAVSHEVDNTNRHMVETFSHSHSACQNERPQRRDTPPRRISSTRDPRRRKQHHEASHPPQTPSPPSLSPDDGIDDVARAMASLNCHSDTNASGPSDVHIDPQERVEMEEGEVELKRENKDEVQHQSLNLFFEEAEVGVEGEVEVEVEGEVEVESEDEVEGEAEAEAEGKGGGKGEGEGAGESDEEDQSERKRQDEARSAREKAMLRAIFEEDSDLEDEDDVCAKPSASASTAESSAKGNGVDPLEGGVGNLISGSQRSEVRVCF